MDLSGKAKDDFYKWFNDKPFYKNEIITGFSFDYNETTTPHYVFNSLPTSMKWGVYKDFFDSVGLYIIIYPYNEDGYIYHCYIIENKDNEDIYEDKSFKGISSNFARTHALDSVCKYYNK